MEGLLQLVTTTLGYLPFQILTLYDSVHAIDVDKVVAYVQSLQKEDGSFAGDIWGKICFSPLFHTQNIFILVVIIRFQVVHLFRSH